MTAYRINLPINMDMVVHSGLLRKNPNATAIQRFCNTFGPTFYSMDKGGIHFVMLDNIVYKNEEINEKNQ